MTWPALAVLAGLLVGPHAIAQEKPKDAAAPAQAKAAGAAAAKDAKKEPEPPKPRIAVFRLAGPVQETPKDEVFNFGGETGIPLETLVRADGQGGQGQHGQGGRDPARAADRRLGPGRGAAAGDRPRPRRQARR